MPQHFSSETSPPLLSSGNTYDLTVDATLQKLPLYNFQVETSCISVEVTSFFERYPLLPGVTLLEGGKYIGMISRRRLLEFFIRPFGKDLFLHQPISVLYSYARTAILELADSTPILTAMQLALRRSPEQLAEPIVVYTAPDIYRLLDVQELNIASWQIRGIEAQVRYERSQAQMIQNDKMASLGRLVDGVAHEILDPVNFIWGNLTHVASYCQDLLRLTAAYDQELADPSPKIVALKQEIEFDFLEQDLTQALASIQTGADRLKKLVAGLQTFCHIDEVYPKPMDLHMCLDSLILLINSRLQGEIEIQKNYGLLPPVYCFIGQLTQVFMNILSQSVDTLLNEAVRQTFHLNPNNAERKTQITITTAVISQTATKSEKLDSRWVSIRMADNGPGMSPDVLQQIRDSFSIEKRADKETSLAISYRIITARHGGKLNLNSQPGKGTEFEILLPLV